MDNITKIRIKNILLDLHNKEIDWNKLNEEQKNKYLKRIATIKDAEEVYAEIAKENNARVLPVGLGTEK